MTNGPTEQLWKLVHDAFEKQANHGLIVLMGSSQDRVELQFRTLNHISELAHATPEHRQACRDVVRGDILVAETSGWLTHETAEKAQKILDDMEDRA